MFRAGILTVSDKGWRGERQDRSGEAIREILSETGAHITNYDIVPDEKNVIAERLITWVDEGNVDVIITTGGTGLGPEMLLPRQLFR